MTKRTGWWLGAVAFAAGAIGAGAYWKRKNMSETRKAADVWARPGMLVTFRAELMPGRERDDRTFRVRELLASGRVSLQGVAGEHAEKEFEPVQFNRPIESHQL